MDCRSSALCPLLGRYKKIALYQLPTSSDVLRHYFFVREFEIKNSNASFDDISKSTIQSIIEVWNKSSIPIIGDLRIKQKLSSIKDQHRNYMRSAKRASFSGKLAEVKMLWEKELFDICSCKCENIADNCTCDKTRKVPAKEIPFLMDQRTHRSMMIGNTDLKTTNALKNRLELLEKKLGKVKDANKELPVKFRKSPSERNSIDQEQLQQRASFPNVVLMADRYNISDRAASAITTGALIDAGLISRENTCRIVDRSKMRRERSKVRDEAMQNFPSSINNIYFDGRKDMTLCQEKLEGHFHRTMKQEEHYVILTEPNSVFLGHISPNSGRAESIKTGIISFLTSNNLHLDQLKAIGCDGTNVNTGVNGGAIRLLEIELGKPLQWFICLFHLNELLLRHYIHFIDGKTKGPRQFAGLIGQHLEKAEQYPILSFPKLTFKNMPSNFESVKDLSYDQSLLLKYAEAISTGYSGPTLGNCKPGPISHARWLTTASRILRLFMSTNRPEDNLRKLANFVMTV